VATNALLERKGARTALVATAGFEDMLTIARQNRRELYNLTPALPIPLVPADLCLAVDERTHHDGTIARAPSGLDDLAARLGEAGVEAVAICLLHSYQEDSNERAVAEALRKAGFGFVSASHEVSPEFREYERASTTVINAYVGPLMDQYLGRLERAWPGAISVLQSNGGHMTASQARRQAVRTVLSGPAGGAIGAVRMARRSGIDKVLAFDMGGTSTDVSLCDGEPRETTEAAIDGFPVRVPMLDIHTVGSGGGSIARVDAGGLLRVGPESAGADPGPACYGAGELATVTDAQVVLGRIGARQLLGGAMRIDPDRAEWAVGRVGAALGLDPVAAAVGILRVADANMERAIRAVSVERGHDPRDFTLVAFGGAGGLHACDLAAHLDIRRVLVPRYAEGLSALGMLLADRVRDYSAAALGRDDVEDRLASLVDRASRENHGADVETTADLRYSGQSYELNVPWSSRGDAAAKFHAEHLRVYGYQALERPVEVVTVRVRARTRSPELAFPPPAEVADEPAATRRIHVGGEWVEAPAITRRHVPPEGAPGPLLVLDYGSTTLVPRGWRAAVDQAGGLLVTRDTPG
jgi:N-methylhydantoinase A